MEYKISITTQMFQSVDQHFIKSTKLQKNPKNKIKTSSLKNVIQSNNSIIKSHSSRNSIAEIQHTKNCQQNSSLLNQQPGTKILINDLYGLIKSI